MTMSQSLAPVSASPMALATPTLIAVGSGCQALTAGVGRLPLLSNCARARFKNGPSPSPPWLSMADSCHPRQIHQDIGGANHGGQRRNGNALSRLPLRAWPSVTGLSEAIHPWGRRFLRG